MDYTQLSLTEQKTMLTQRIHALEAEHFAQQLNADMHAAQEQTPDVVAAADQTAADMTKLELAHTAATDALAVIDDELVAGEPG